jgi:acetolactate synthase I/II/III large subunit
MKVRVSDYIAHFLSNVHGVRHVFLLSGGGMMHLLDAISRTPDLRYICHHHEQAAAMAAEGYSRQSGELGVCLATSGPGATNLVTGIAGAWIDSTPLLFLTGQSKRAQSIRGTGAKNSRQIGVFEVDIVSVVEPITKYSVFVNDPQMIRFHLEKAVWLASTGRPGPVLLDLPLDVQGAEIDESSLTPFLPPPPEKLGPEKVGTEVDFSEVIEACKQAERPLLLAGHGVRASGAVDLFRRFVKALNIPTVTTQLALDILPYDDARFIGHPGMKGDRPANFAVQKSDLILVLGSSLHPLTTGYERERFAPSAKKIWIDPDLGRTERVFLTNTENLTASVPDFLERGMEILSTSEGIKPSQWHEQCRAWKSQLGIDTEQRPAPLRGTDYYSFLQILDESARGDETLVTDAGSAFYIVGQAFKSKKDQRAIISGGLGAMGYALPASTGAALARRKNESNGAVLCITGDGSFQTNLHELSNLVLHDLPVKVFVFNSHGYASIRHTQNIYFQGNHAGVDPQTGVHSADFGFIAKAYGIRFQRWEKKEDVARGLKEVLSRTGPDLIEIEAPLEQEIIPQVLSYREEKGTLRSHSLEEMSPKRDGRIF